jgi:L-serine dehydratase
MVSLLDIIGPVMVGPSSSHTAGACRLGLLARGLVGGTPERAKNCTGHSRNWRRPRTDKAIVAGLMGFRPDDDRIRTALEIAEHEPDQARRRRSTKTRIPTASACRSSAATGPL